MKNKKYEKEEIEKIIKEHKPLAKKVASKYFIYADELGIDRKKLIEASINGAVTGYPSYAAKKRVSYKLATYLTFWMRRSVHIALVLEILKISKKQPEKAKNLLLEMFENFLN